MQVQASREQAELSNLLKDYLARQNILNYKNVILNIDSIRDFKPELANAIVHNILDYYAIIRRYFEISDHDEQNQLPNFMAKNKNFIVGFQGNFGENYVSLRELRSKKANQLVRVQGIMTRIEKISSYLGKSVHYNPKTKTHESKQYLDHFNFEQNEKKSSRILKFDQNRNPLEFRLGNSSFKDTQKGVLQELPENALSGQLPISVPVIFQHNLCGVAKPGDRIIATGIYVLTATLSTKFTGIFSRSFYCLNAKPLETKVVLNKKLKKNFPQAKDCYQICSNSIAPSILGLQMVKKAILLMLVGGVEKTVNETHLRGDINILLVGDPGTAKSQLLRYVLNNFDKAIGTTGSGASGVGLTASITTDQTTKQRIIEAGAMVLADRGVVCIDEFDKMNENDRVAIHEAMEQQTITINKAGLSSRLNARCSVFAAANPIYGEYQEKLTLDRNIGMPDSLLSRFDLVFIIKDLKDCVLDNQIATRVTSNHMMGEIIGNNIQRDQYDGSFIIDQAQNGKKTVKEKQKIYDPKYNNNKVDSDRVLTQNALKDYIDECKIRKPVLNEEASELISLMFSFFRAPRSQDTSSYQLMPITVRVCENIIRLSEAHAKIRSSEFVEPQDCAEAFRLIAYCITQNVADYDDDLERMMKDCRKSLRKRSIVEESEEESKVDKSSRKPISRRSLKKRQELIQEEKEGSVPRGQVKKIHIKTGHDEAAELMANISLGENKELRSEIYTLMSKQIAGQRNRKCRKATIIDQMSRRKPEMGRQVFEDVIAGLENAGKITVDEVRGETYIYMI